MIFIYSILYSEIYFIFIFFLLAILYLNFLSLKQTATGDKPFHLVAMEQKHGYDKFPGQKFQWRICHCTSNIKQMQPVWICVFSRRPFEDTFKNAQWRKVKQLQPVWICILQSKFFEETCEKTQWGKIDQAGVFHRICCPSQYFTD